MGIDWNLIPNFKPAEFSEDPDKYADPLIIFELQEFRTALGKSVNPSPAPGALARFDGSQTSQHYVGNPDNPIRKSTAIDFFTSEIPAIAFMKLVNRGMKHITAIGVYFDTRYKGEDRVMFHIDNRGPGNSRMPLVWFREDGRYHYVHEETRGELKRLMYLLYRDV